jgi:hypothetical protein
MPDSGTIGNQRLSLAVPNQSNIESEGRMFNLQYVFETKCLNPSVVEMPNGGTRNVWFGNQMNPSNTATDGNLLTSF